ncbi:hypothetical protein AwErysi_09980 [Erysipelotrichaceae bacterium]|nr:hypothetical protein AwErysi_09980 [Erysipelotrichaceae bacterium]
MLKIFCYFIIVLSAFCIPLQAQSNLEYENAGSYPVTFSIWDEELGEEVEKTIFVTIIRPKTVINEQTGEAIDAKDILIGHNTAKNLSSEDLIAHAQAHAWDLRDGSPVAVVAAQVEIIDRENGFYRVIFSTEKGTATQINMIETKAPLTPQNEEYINILDVHSTVNFWSWSIGALFVILSISLGILYLGIKLEVRSITKLLYRHQK